MAVVVVTGDRGLCGGYNAQMIKKAEARIVELQSHVREAVLALWTVRGGQGRRAGAGQGEGRIAEKRSREITLRARCA